MKIINSEVQTHYKYNGRFYVYKEDINDKNYKIGDVIRDLRTEEFKLIENTEDYTKIMFLAPEMYYVLIEI